MTLIALSLLLALPFPPGSLPQLIQTLMFFFLVFFIGPVIPFTCRVFPLTAKKIKIKIVYLAPFMTSVGFTFQFISTQLPPPPPLLTQGLFKIIIIRAAKSDISFAVLISLDLSLTSDPQTVPPFSKCLNLIFVP